jgi:serine/threonine protein kinase
MMSIKSFITWGQGVSGDIYSLSVILFELFSGTDPFPGDFWKIYSAKMAGFSPELPQDFPVFLQSVVRAGVDDIKRTLLVIHHRCL